MNDQIKNAILQGRSSLEMKKIAMQSGTKTLRQSALTKMVKGVVPATEVLKATSSDSDE